MTRSIPIALTAAGVTFLAAWAGASWTGAEPGRADSGEVGGERQTQIASGVQWAAVTIVAHSCGACRSDSIRDALAGIGPALRRQLAGGNVDVIGVVVDPSVDDGISILREIGGYDEVHAGNNWLNSLAIEYLWRDQPGRPAVPQVVLIRRHIRAVGSTVVVSSDTVIDRYVGGAELIPWAAAGYPLEKALLEQN